MRPPNSRTSPRCVSIDRAIREFSRVSQIKQHSHAVYLPQTTNHQPPTTNHQPPLPPLPPKPPQQPWTPVGTPPQGQLANKNCKSLRNSSKISSFFISFFTLFCAFFSPEPRRAISALFYLSFLTFSLFHSCGKATIFPKNLTKTTKMSPKKVQLAQKTAVKPIQCSIL